MASSKFFYHIDYIKIVVKIQYYNLQILFYTYYIMPLLERRKVLIGDSINIPEIDISNGVLWKPSVILAKVGN